mmetsp:Transcript_12088/g.48670  ORF Transcript_12088/g.48670 Transcript_12088/m.48670 type:complete len:383 (-) Transcript_12088:98-1246(-)
MADFAEQLTNQPVVIDNGSGTLKAGFAGENLPQTIFPNYVGTPKHLRVMAGAVEGNTFVGKRAEDLRGLMKVKYPMEHGIVNDWEDMLSVWKAAYQELHIPSEDHPVLLTEAPLNPRRNREKAAEIFFETFNVPALFVSMQAVLSLYASGRTTGIVLDSGDGVTHAVPIYEGFAMPHAIMRNDIAGREVTKYLEVLLKRGGCGYNFHTSAEREVVKAIKERVCYVAFDPQQEEEKVDTSASAGLVKYKLPDGSIIDVGAEAFRAPEALFNPELVGLEYCGIHECVTNSILRTDLDMRKELYSNIVLSGGSTLFKGFGDRMLRELVKLAPKDTKIKIAAPPDRQMSTWVGGSILAALPTFRKMWVWRSEYNEDGPRILHRKTF